MAFVRKADFSPAIHDPRPCARIIIVNQAQISSQTLRREVLIRGSAIADDIFMLALSIRQPFAELILRGIKTAELRGRPTNIIGQRFYIYAAKAKAKPPIWSKDLQAGLPPAWLIELGRQVGMIKGDWDMPTGVIVGTAVIERVEEMQGQERRSDEAMERRRDGLPTAHCPLPAVYSWHLTDVKRLSRPRKPKGHPQPVWWRPFD